MTRANWSMVLLAGFAFYVAVMAFHYGGQIDDTGGFIGRVIGIAIMVTAFLQKRRIDREGKGRDDSGPK